MTQTTERAYKAETMPDGTVIYVPEPLPDLDIMETVPWADRDNSDPLAALYKATLIIRSRYGRKFVRAVFPSDAVPLMAAGRKFRAAVAVFNLSEATINLDADLSAGEILRIVERALGLSGGAEVSYNAKPGAVRLFTEPFDGGLVETAVIRYA